MSDKLYQYQDKLTLKLITGIDLTNATTYIIYTTPSGTVGTWNGTIEAPAANGTFNYTVEGTYDLYESGNWQFYAVVVDTAGKRAPGEPFTEFIYEEGTP